MSMAVKVSAAVPESLGAAREQTYYWTLVLILGVIAASAIGAWFYAEAAPLIDPSMVAP